MRGQNERIRALTRSVDVSASNPQISAWCIAQQLDHLLKVASSIVRRINQPGVEPLKNGVTFLGRMVLTSGWIPRGRGKAPERLVGTICSAAEIEAALVQLETMMDAIDVDAARSSRAATVPHPKFGGLTPSQALRFAAIHTDHHLKIVAEILATLRVNSQH